MGNNYTSVFGSFISGITPRGHREEGSMIFSFFLFFFPIYFVVQKAKLLFFCFFNWGIFEISLNVSSPASVVRISSSNEVPQIAAALDNQPIIPSNFVQLCDYPVSKVSY